jgi:NADH-quinone oxidoreductase subunit J
MTTRPRLADFDRGVVTGLAAVALFGLMAAVFLTAQFDQPDGFPAGLSVVKSIGFAMFDISSEDVIVGEGFLAVFLIIAIALDAALDGSLMLAERDEGGEE